MSQQQIFIQAGEIVPGYVEFLVGDSGLPVGPNALFEIFVKGNSVQGISTAGTPLTNTLTITAADATTAQKGVVLLASNAETIAGIVTTKANTPDDLKAKLGVQTQYGIPYGAGTAGVINWLADAMNGQIPIGSTGAAPVLGNITSNDGSVTITNGAGTIDLSVTDELSGTAITTDNTPTTIITITLAIGQVVSIDALIAAFEGTTPFAVGGQIVATCFYTGVGNSVIVGTPSIIINASPGVTATFEITTLGSTVLITVVGEIGFTINWKAIARVVYSL